MPYSLDEEEGVARAESEQPIPWHVHLRGNTLKGFKDVYLQKMAHIRQSRPLIWHI